MPSINEEEDSKAESNSPRANLKKRSITNLRFEFQPDIMVEASPNKEDQEDNKEVEFNESLNKDDKRNISPAHNYLNIRTNKYK